MAEELSKKIKLALDETRMMILGAQILVGFAFRGVFQDGFATLPTHARQLIGVALLLMLLAMALLILPEPYHRIAEQGHDTGHFDRLLGHVSLWALAPFIASIAIDFFIVGEKMGGTATGIVAACAMATLAFFFWCGFAVWHRSRGEGVRKMAEERAEAVERTPLHEKIDEMLIEGRVVLPGAQALFGFQLAIVLTQSFETLPPVPTALHAVALGAVGLSIVLLIAPASYHRIVYGGEDSEDFLRIGGWLVTWSTAPLAIGLAADVFVVMSKIIGAELPAAIIAGGLFLLLIGMWHILPFIARERRRGALQAG